MRLKVTKVVLLFIAAVSALKSSKAQGWERIYGAAESDGFSDVLTTPDGDCIAVGGPSVVGILNKFSPGRIL